jgi:hypothetical protein
MEAKEIDYRLVDARPVDDKEAYVIRFEIIAFESEEIPKKAKNRALVNPNPTTIRRSGIRRSKTALSESE